MKKLLKIVGVLVLILVGVLLVLMFKIGAIVEKAIPTVGSKLLGVPVSVEKVGVRILAGKLTIKNLVVGNPEGFKTDHSFELGTLTVHVRPKSVFSDKIVIEKVLIEAPKITYELGIGKSNLGKLQEQIAGDPKDDKAVEKETVKAEPEDETPGKKVVITELVITGGRINLSAKALGGSEIPIPLPTLTMENIGEEGEGASLSEIIEMIAFPAFVIGSPISRGFGLWFCSRSSRRRQMVCFPFQS